MWEILTREIVPSAKEQTPSRDNPPCGLHGETAWTYKKSTGFSGTENLYSFKTLPLRSRLDFSGAGSILGSIATSTPQRTHRRQKLIPLAHPAHCFLIPVFCS